MNSCLMVIDVQASFRHRPYFSEAALPAYLAAQNALIAGCVAAGVPVVVGTTGLDSAAEEAMTAAAARIPVLHAPNMSLGVNLLSVLIKQAARALEASGWDIEVLEMHHKHKVDAPSGTALLLGEAAAEGRGISLADHSVRVRDGHTGPREEGSIGFATLRGGSVIGEHSVLFASEGEMDAGIVPKGCCNREIEIALGIALMTVSACASNSRIGISNESRPSR